MTVSKLNQHGILHILQRTKPYHRLFPRLPASCLPVSCLPVSCLPVSCLPVSRSLRLLVYIKDPRLTDLRHPSCPDDREPAFADPFAAFRRESHVFEGGISTGGRFLVEKDTCLYFSVLHILRLISQEIGPDGSLRTQCPDPDLFPGFFRVVIPMSEAEIPAGIESGKKIGIDPQDVIAVIGPIIVFSIIGDVPAIRQQWPWRGFPAVADIMISRKYIFQIWRRIGCRGRPMVPGCGQVHRVVPEDMGLDPGFVAGQADLHPPFGPGGQVHRPDPTGGASIGVHPG